MPPRFIHLRMHTEYSISDSTIRIPEAISFAQKDQQGALAMTDLNNLFGFIKFYQNCRKAGIKAIAGCDISVKNSLQNTPSRILLLCRNIQGYQSLCELITEAYLSQNGGAPLLDPIQLSPQKTENLILLSGGHVGEINSLIRNGNERQAREVAKSYAERFPNRFYLELHCAGFDKEKETQEAIIRLAHTLHLPVIATHPIQFLRPEDYQLHQARVCIAESTTLADTKRKGAFTKQQYFYTQEDMHTAFAHIPSALRNTVEVAQQCTLTIPLNTSQLPIFPIPEHDSHDNYLKRMAYTGLKHKLPTLYPNLTARSAAEAKYWSRLDTELSTIQNMGFASYFLIVADFIQWAKSHDIPVGPGRGSGAGSLVAYAIDITQLDPLKYDLLFERFLNPERVSMPDFDIDFCQDKRHLVIDYVKEKYGANSVSQIITFGTLAAKAAIRDIGRVLNLPYGFVDGLAKMIPMELGITIAQARQLEPALAAREESEEEVKHCLQLAEQIEGIVRNVGTHAGGILIAPRALTTFCPLYLSSHTEGIVSHYDKDSIETVGLVKFDFLGLRTLTIIEQSLNLIREHHPDTHCTLDIHHFNDEQTYALLSVANTTGVFQLESRGMRELLKKIQPSTFEDIIAILALYRPGPLGSGMVDDFIHRKQGKTQVEYIHPALQPILQSTYGVIIYQEQVMLIAQTIGGYSLGKADLLRRAMGKKKPEEMAKHRSIFKQGAIQQGYDASLAEHLFDLMEKFAEYGFNKSHTAAYAVLSYHTAWLKTHYPACFMSATLSSEMDATEKVYHFYLDCLAHQMTVLPPSINSSFADFQPASPSIIAYGLSAIRGVGRNAAQHIVDVRKSHGPFLHLVDFCQSVQLNIVNKRALEALIKSGACDMWGKERDQLLMELPSAIEHAQHNRHHATQSSLFDDISLSSFSNNKQLESITWSAYQKLYEEKQALGFYMSAHPFDLYYDEVKTLIKRHLDTHTPQKEPQWVCGIISHIRKTSTKRGMIAFITIEDGKSSMDLALFSDKFQEYRELCQVDSFIIAYGRIQKDDYNNQLRMNVDKAFSLSSFRVSHCQYLICITNTDTNIPALYQLLKTHQRSSGKCRLRCEHHHGALSCMLEDTEKQWYIEPTETLLKELRALNITARLVF